MEMTEAEQKFATAALAVFQRFGVRKATMEEIAAEAGVSKPTLYATFRNKDAALAGAIVLAKHSALAEVQTAWKTAATLDQKLDILFERLVLAGFDMLHNSPDPEAFETALGAASQAAIEKTNQRDIAALQSVLEGCDTQNLGSSTAEFAEFIMLSAMNTKRLSQSRDALEQYLRTLKATVLSVVR